MFVVRKAAPLLCFVLVLALAACGRAPAATEVPPTVNAAPEAATLTVFAAASLTEAFAEVGQEFEAAHPGVKVVFNLAGSQQLAQQIVAGAPADLFASANQKQMDAAGAADRVAAGSSQIFARNRLVVIVPGDNPAGLAQLQDLAKPGLKLVLAAKEVPVGQYALDFLDKASQDPSFGSGYKDAVLANAVSFEENVKSVLTKVVLGEGDAGIVYVTDITPDRADAVGRIDIPDDLNTVATYPIAALSDAAEPELARAFIDLVLSPQGQEVLAKYGFLPAK